MEQESGIGVEKIAMSDEISLRSERALTKTGLRNIKERHIPQKTYRFVKDFVTTLVEGKWRYMLAVFVGTYVISWFFFGILYYLIGLMHGDLSYDEEGNRLSKVPCINDATKFAGYLLTSVEAQVSTGYGSKYPTEECPHAIVLMIIQLTIGLIIDGSMIGIMYSKMVRPPKQADYKFSKKAVICMRDGILCLIFRLVDIKEAHSINSKVRAFLFEEQMSSEGERLGRVQQKLNLEHNGRVFLLWPTTVCHLIDSSSPFYKLSAKELSEKRFEIIVSLTGISHTTGQTTQARTSYLSREILWGYRFRNVINYDNNEEYYWADSDTLDDVELTETPTCSAKELDDLKGGTSREENSMLIDNFYLGHHENEPDEEEATLLKSS